MANLRKFKSRYPIVLFANHPWPDTLRVGDPEILKGSRFPDGKPNPFGVNNAVFLTAMRVAQANGYTHVVYLESDIRVGQDYWDEKIFEEFFGLGRPCIAAGSLCCYNPVNFSPEAARRWHRLVAGNTKRNVPCATYGWMRADQKGPSCVFPNGALGVYDIAWMGKLFDLEHTLDIAAITTAWDMRTGILLWQMFEEDAYEVLGQLNCIYSGYSDIVTTPEERRQMLRDGKIVAYHQEKTDYQP